MSVVLVTFPGAPKVSEEAQRKDAELNATIEKEVNRKCALLSTVRGWLEMCFLLLIVQDKSKKMKCSTL